jgi:hypothetical protein
MQCRFEKLLTVICLAFVLAFFFTHAEAQPPLGDPASPSGSPTVGQDNFENAFSKGSMESGSAFGGTVGLKIFGATVYHDFVLGSIHLGRIMSDTKCAGAWYEGSFELSPKHSAATRSTVEAPLLLA